MIVRAHSPAIPTGPRTTATVGGSPYIYQNTSGGRQLVVVSGGTVTTIEFSRDGVTYDNVNLLSGEFYLNPGDRIRITYLLAPTAAIYPI